MHLAKVVRISRAKFSCNRLSNCTRYSRLRESHFFETQCSYTHSNHNKPTLNCDCEEVSSESLDPFNSVLRRSLPLLPLTLASGNKNYKKSVTNEYKCILCLNHGINTSHTVGKMFNKITVYANISPQLTNCNQLL